MKSNINEIDASTSDALNVARKLLVGARVERVVGRALNDLQILARMVGAKALAIELSAERGRDATVQDVHLVMSGQAVLNALAQDGLVLGVDAGRAFAMLYLSWYRSEAAGRGVPFEMAQAVGRALGPFKPRELLGMGLMEYLDA